MNVLILKLGASGDVVRTTSLLRALDGRVTWITAAKNRALVQDLRDNLRALSWEERDRACDTEYDLAINLEDTGESAGFVEEVRSRNRFGCHWDDQRRLTYTESSRGWFDLSLISAFGKEKADALKLQNRRTYQDLIFSGLGFRFDGQTYLLPPTPPGDLRGDVALAPAAGPVWPMKNWAFYDRLQAELTARGFLVHVLPKRDSLLEHLADVRQHRCLVSGDSLPMHLALGSGVRCVSLFTCTSPWEIHPYGVQTQLVSPLLAEFFFKRGFDPRATTAIPFEEVLDATLAQLEAAPPA